MSACIGSVLAELRPDDRVVAVDADTGFGKLGSRVDPKAQSSFWELAGDQHLETSVDIRSRVGHNSAGSFVLPGDAAPARRRVLDPAVYRDAALRLDRHFTISIVYCSSTIDAPVTQEVLRDVDAGRGIDAVVECAAPAGQTLDWLAARGLTGLLQCTSVVLNDPDGHAVYCVLAGSSTELRRYREPPAGVFSRSAPRCRGTSQPICATSSPMAAISASETGSSASAF